MQCCTALKASLESQQGDQNKEDHHEFEDSVDYIVSSRPAWAMGGNNQRERERERLFTVFVLLWLWKMFLTFVFVFSTRVLAK